MNRRRNLGIAIILIVAFAAAVAYLPLTAALAVGALLGLSGMVLFRQPTWRTASLASMSVLLGLAGLNVAFWLVDPRPVNVGVVKQDSPEHWLIDDDIVGYKLMPSVTVDAMAKYDDQILYHTKYTIDATSARMTPGSGTNGPTYLFVGDSLIFSETLPDLQTMASQFAQSLQPSAHVVNLGVPGYGVNNLVRAVETGQYDPYVIGKVKAVITWIAPYHMERVTGDAGWLTWSPRYVLEDDGKVRYTGSFLVHRLTNPLDGGYYVGRHNFAWVARAARASLQREQTDLYVALLARLRDLVKQRFGAPLVVIANWPEWEKPGENDLEYVPAYRAIAALGMPMVSVRQMVGPTRDWPMYFTPHDGHPNARLAGMVAQSLKDTIDR
jgi:hypothetical protein